MVTTTMTVQVNKSAELTETKTGKKLLKFVGLQREVIQEKKVDTYINFAIFVPEKSDTEKFRKLFSAGNTIICKVSLSANSWIKKDNPSEVGTAINALIKTFEIAGWAGNSGAGDGTTSATPVESAPVSFANPDDLPF